MVLGGKVGILVAFLFLAGLASAIPGIPHQFYGTVITNNHLAADGVAVTAKINDVNNASTITVDGNYGYNPAPFFVTDPNNSFAGRTIVFFVNNVEAARFVFENGGFTRLDLNVTGNFPDVNTNTPDNNSNDDENTDEDTPDQPGNPPGGGGPPGSSPGSPGGGPPLLDMNIDGNCLNQQIVVNVWYHTNQVPVAGATVTVTRDNNVVAEYVTTSQGQGFFVFSEEGTYRFKARRSSSLVSANKNIVIARCSSPPPVTPPANPLTDQNRSPDSNSPNTPLPPVPPQNPASNPAPTGFLGLGLAGNVLIGLLILLIIIIAIVVWRSTQKASSLKR